SNGDPRFPFGTGLPGALAGIAQADQLRKQNAIEQQTQARQNALAAGTLANQQSEEAYRTAQTAALQYKGEEKPLGTEFTDANNNRVIWVTGPNGLRQQILGKVAPPVPTAESVKVDFNSTLQKALSSIPEGGLNP